LLSGRRLPEVDVIPDAWLPVGKGLEHTPLQFRHMVHAASAIERRKAWANDDLVQAQRATPGGFMTSLRNNTQNVMEITDQVYPT
jgi:hypothetical protein